MISLILRDRLWDECISLFLGIIDSNKLDLGVANPQIWVPSILGSWFLCFQIRDKLYGHLISHEVILKFIMH